MTNDAERIMTPTVIYQSVSFVAMKMTELFLSQLDRETKSTRRTLEQVPDGKNDFKPHPKSMPMGYLSALVATIPNWIATMIEKNELDLATGQGRQEALS